MSKKFRTFKSTEVSGKPWAGKSSAVFSPMRNTDIARALKTGDWSEMIEKAECGMRRSIYNKENNIPNPACYDKFMNTQKKIKLPLEQKLKKSA